MDILKSFVNPSSRFHELGEIETLYLLHSVALFPPEILQEAFCGAVTVEDSVIESFPM